MNGWKRNELRHWCLERIRSISGTTTLEDGLRHADVRTLITFGYMAAFGYMAFVQAPHVSPPATPSTPTPKSLKTLESDFFPVLLREIKSNASAFPSFKERLEQAERHVLELAGRVEASARSATADQYPDGLPSHSIASNVTSSDSGWAAVGVMAVFCAFCYVVGKFQDKAGKN